MSKMQKKRGKGHSNTIEARGGKEDEEVLFLKVSFCLSWFQKEGVKPKEDYQNPTDSSSLSSYEITIPCSKRSILELLHLIIPPKPIHQITLEEFLTESELFKLVEQYFSDNWNFNRSQLNDLIGKDGSWGGTKQKGKKDNRIRGRTYNVVEANLRDFKWKDVSNISQFRYLVRTTQPQYVTIGYVHKSNTQLNQQLQNKSLFHFKHIN